METIKTAGQRFFAFLYGDEANQNEISFFDVKALYDSAYDEKAKARACMKTFKTLLEQAEILDLAYRAQLAERQARLYGKAA